MTPIFKNAKFIWCEGAEKTINAYVNFHETVFKHSGAEYKIAITADSNYAVYVNGSFCDGGQYADYPDSYKVYDELDLTPFLIDGENELTIIGYCQNEDSSTYRVGTPGVMYSVTENGRELLCSSENTKVGVNPCYISGPVDKVSGQLSFSFEYDGRGEGNEIPGKAVVTRSFDDVHPRPIKKLKLGERCHMTCVTNGSFKDGKQNATVGQRMQYAYLGMGERTRAGESDKGVRFEREEGCDGVYVVYDMGREESGFITLDVEVPTDTEILVGWGEHMEDMRLRTYVGGRNFAARVVATAGRFRFIHPFKRSGGRYVALHVYGSEITVHYAGITPTDYPTTADISFTCADHMHSEIYETCKRTLLMCMHEHYEDCPWREQALYAMDSRNQMLCGYYTFKEFDFAKSSLRLIGLSLRDDNMLELCSPARVSITIPSFCAIYSVQLWEYLLFSGDTDFAREMAPVSEKICREFIRRTDENGLIPILQEGIYWNFYEWADDLDGVIGKTDSDDSVTYDLPLCAFVSMAYDSLYRIYTALGETDKAEFFRDAASKLNKAVHSAFYDNENGLYYTKIRRTTGEKYHLAQLTQSLAVYSGICPEECLDKVLENLACNEKLIKVTLSHSIFRYDALLKRPEIYGRKVFDEVAEVYGRMLKNGATTFWETIAGGDDFGFAGSLCHGWAAVPSYLYFRYCVGLYPEMPGKMGEKKPLPVSQTGIYEVATDF
ncbi:MAG: hypothetical protein ACI4XJ_09405 [Eubacteriales bacterium]